jgi:hypothetical protein
VNTDQLPKRLDGYPEWSGVRLILGDFDDDPRVWAHVDYGEQDGQHWLNIDWDAILGEPWSGGERKILTGAMGIWTGNPVRLSELAGGEMGDHYWRLFTLALDAYRERMFSEPPPPPQATAQWSLFGYVAYDMPDEQGVPTGDLMPVPERLHRRVDWAYEDLEDADAAVNDWLKRNGYPPLKVRR